GIGFAVLAGVGWGSYILLTQRVGDRFSGIGSLSITITIAAATAAIAGIPQATGNLSTGIVAAAAGLALLLPVLPFALELLAPRPGLRSCSPSCHSRWSCSRCGA